MEVLYKLRIDGNDNSVMLKDGEIQYPVFMESLHSVEIFKNLLNSGYKFCGLPFDFKKDGMSIMELPVKDYTPSMYEMQDMFDLNSMQKLSQEELRKSLSQEDVQYLPEPKAEYSIYTREEFLNYLTTIQTIHSALDVRPINYFVHPSARFTMDEWQSGEYDNYFRIMAARRNMSWEAFNLLREWLITKGMDENADSTGIINAYYAWGIDGLNVKFVNKQQKTVIIQEDYIMMNSVSDDAYEVHIYDSALIDRYGAIFPPEDIPAGFGGWRIAVKNGVHSSAISDLMGKLREGQYGVVPVKTKSQDEITLYNGLKDTIKVTPYAISCGRARTTNIIVHMPDISNKTVPHLFWAKKYTARVKEMSNLYALAWEILQKRKYTAEVSTYKALQRSGCDIKACINYVLDKSQPEEEDIESFPTQADVTMYLDGDYDTESLSSKMQEKIDTIEDIVNGENNTDGVATGVRLDAQVDIDTIYKYLYCAHFCKTHVSVQDIYNLVKDIDRNVTKAAISLETGRRDVDVLQLKSDIYTIDVPCEEQKAKINGYFSDLDSYLDKQANQCCGFLKVVRVAKEYGTQGCDRHVAFEALTVNLLRDGRVAQYNLEKLMEIYDQQLENVPVMYRADHKYYKRRACMSAYFRVAEEGVMRLPASISTEPYKLPAELVASIRSTIKTKITSTAVYCAKMYEEGCFTHYCVNADITPYYVFPRGSAVIPSAPFPGLWYDWVSMGSPAIREKLIASGIISPAYIPWTNRYMNERYFATEGMCSEANLANYMMYCNKYRTETKPNEEFTRAPHLESLFYRRLNTEADRVTHSTNLREEGKAPSMVVSVGELLTSKTFADKLAVDIHTIASTKTIRPFTGFSAEDFDILGDIDKVQLPYTEGGQYLIVDEDSDTISTDTQTNLPAYTLSQLAGRGYPIVNIWGRKYVFCDMFGALWEATI